MLRATNLSNGERISPYISEGSGLKLVNARSRQTFQKNLPLHQ